MALSIEIIFSYKDFFKTHEVWSLMGLSLYLNIDEIGPLYDGFLGDNINIRAIDKHLKASPKQMSFDFEFGKNKPYLRPFIRFEHVTDWSFARFSVVNLDSLIASKNYWLANVLSHDRFVYARLFDTEYNSLQNMTSLQSFELKGIDHSHLPKKSNGLPFPIGETIVDISANPGLWEFKPGYIEAVASEMWLGKHFFELVNLSVEDVKKTEWLQVNELDNSIHLLAYEKPFNSADGLQGELQNKLRHLLYARTNK